METYLNEYIMKKFDVIIGLVAIKLFLLNTPNILLGVMPVLLRYKYRIQQFNAVLIGCVDCIISLLLLPTNPKALAFSVIFFTARTETPFAA